MLHRNRNKMMREQRPKTYDQPAEWAQNILCFGYGECRAPRSGGSGERVPKAMRIATGQSEVETPALSAYPNPAGAWANLVYEMKAAPDHAYLAIRDITGKEVARIPVQRAEGQAVWDTREVAPGTYTVELMNAGASAGSVKIMVKQ